MTIYSMYQSRNNIQVLATYSAESGMHSEVVARFESASKAKMIVDGLNRASVCATLPVSVWDCRNGSFQMYPSDHLRAMADPSRRNDLLSGAHSLWYEFMKLHLHQALTDIDTALEGEPESTRAALEEELATETSQLHGALAEFEGDPIAGFELQRGWDFNRPTIPYDGGLYELGASIREAMDRAELEDIGEDLQDSIENLRLLFKVHLDSESAVAELHPPEIEILCEPLLPERHGYYLTISAPGTSSNPGSEWTIGVSRWVSSDDGEDSESLSDIGVSLIQCKLGDRPHRTELVNLLNLAEGDDGKRLETWASTPVGEMLDGTNFAVTERLESALPKSSRSETEQLNRAEAARIVDLFPPSSHHCDDDDCEECEDTITPRIAYLAVTALEELETCARMDITTNGHEPVRQDDDRWWEFFDRFPPATYSMGLKWREKVVDSIGYLLSDLQTGEWPEPRNFAEEMIMHLMFEDATEYQEDMAKEDRIYSLIPESSGDDLEGAHAITFQDTDILFLFDANLAKLADVRHFQNREMGIGDMRPISWFKYFQNVDPR
jgi:hypothetical protein